MSATLDDEQVTRRDEAVASMMLANARLAEVVEGLSEVHAKLAELRGKAREVVEVLENADIDEPLTAELQAELWRRVRRLGDAVDE